MLADQALDLPHVHSGLHTRKGSMGRFLEASRMSVTKHLLEGIGGLARVSDDRWKTVNVCQGDSMRARE